jgi:hypothetical protein
MTKEKRMPAICGVCPDGRKRERRGSVPMWAKAKDAVVPAEVEANIGGGSPIQAEAWREANANAITGSCNRHPISGFYIFKALLCQIQKEAKTIIESR